MKLERMVWSKSRRTKQSQSTRRSVTTLKANTFLSSNILIVIALLFVTSCATTIPVTAKLYCPPDLVIEKIMAAELAPLSDDVYERLVRRDRAQRDRIITLCNIIQTTHE